MSTLLDKLQWRYAAKKMDAAKVVPQDKVERIIEAARLAPTSSGLQGAGHQMLLANYPARGRQQVSLIGAHSIDGGQ